MDNPLVNGNMYGFADVQFKLKGKAYPVYSINYSQNPNTAKSYGNQRIARGKVKGQLEAEASASMYKEDYNEMLQDLGEGYLSLNFDVVVSYADEGKRAVTDTLVGCSLGEVSTDLSEGNDAAMIEFGLDPLYIKFNGIEPYEKTT